MNDPQGNNQLILDILDEIKLVTEPMRNCDFKRTENVIIQLDNFDWTFKWLAVLLNELSCWQIDSNNGFRKQKHASGSKYFFFRFVLDSSPNYYIILNVEEKITVKFHKTILHSWVNEDYKEHYVKKAFFLKLTTRGTHAILKNSNLLFYSIDDFSSAFASFCFSFVENSLAPRSDEMSPIYDFYENYLMKIQYEPIGFNDLVKKTEDYFFFIFASIITREKSSTH